MNNNTNSVNRFVGPHETLMGINRYNTVFTLDKFGFVNQWKLVKYHSSVARKEVVRQSDNYVASFPTSSAGEKSYKFLKERFPSMSFRKIYRGINESCKEHGWVHKWRSSHFDVYKK